ncbi:MAG: T9SS type A sorting domain-containing protein [Chitinophagales bacterium]
MKRILTTQFIFLISIVAYTQVCTPDPACLSGICPDSITNLPVTDDNQTTYAATVTVIVPEDTVSGGLTLDYQWIKMDSVKGLPSGFSYTCEPSTCVFPGNDASCIRISGNPSTAGPGTYQVKAYVKAKLTHWLLGTFYGYDSVTYLRIQIDDAVTCGIPTGLASSAITSSSATVSWDNMGASTYKLKYKLSTATTWTSVNTTATSYNLSGLTACSQYKWNVTATCPGTGNFKSQTKKFTTTGCRLGETEEFFVDADEDVVSIYPNPATNSITLNYFSNFENDQQVMIVDMNGKFLLNEMIAMFEGDNSISLDISSFPSGMYMLKIIDTEGQYISKFIKE